MVKQVVGLALLMTGCDFDSAGVDWAPESMLADGGAPDDAAVHADGLVDASAGAMATVAAAPFTMGCATEGELCRRDELPGRRVDLSSFTIDRHEVTWHDYGECIDAEVCTEPRCAAPPSGDDLPVVCVTWFQARDYCAWLGKRLPSEAEWEKAARGGDGFVYAWGNQPAPSCALANYATCGGELDEVGRHGAGRSPYGVDDMAGNAFEWVNDWYSESYYAVAPGHDPPGPPSGNGRVARGGSFAFDPSYLRASLRSRDDPNSSFADLGFRCAR